MYWHTPLCVLSNTLEVNCKHFDNILLAGTSTDTLCQSVQGTLAVSTPLLMLSIINEMLMCAKVKALCLCGDVIDSNVLIKWNFTADYQTKGLAVQWVVNTMIQFLLLYQHGRHPGSYIFIYLSCPHVVLTYRHPIFNKTFREFLWTWQKHSL